MIQNLSCEEIEAVGGGVNLNGYRMSTNVQQQTFATWIGAAGSTLGSMIWARSIVERLAE